MYDTIKLWLPLNGLDSGYINQITDKLISPKVKIDLETGEKSVHGQILGMDMMLKQKGLYLGGSICKSYLKDNFQTLTRQDSKEAIAQLSDILLLPIKDSKVCRIDIAQNFFMNNKVENYYNHLGQSNYFKRLEQPKSVYYQNGLRTKLFYNKIEEVKINGNPIPFFWHNKNVLRYELRFTKKLPKQFNRAELLAKNLYDEKFYIEIIKRWQREYVQIKKINLLKPKSNDMTSKNANDYLLSSLIEMQGQDAILSMTELWKNNFKSDREFYRFKAKIKNMKDMVEPSELVAELDSKIEKQLEYYY
ncbi:phage/plasmid replication protein [Emticicia sp. BO119]|uniref:phage/plasmid replication domain-containing protein n=1 Tax=Emticicia sp. BO119 TaxID=2757768 RepID=UPI0015F0A2E1|nr:phage/plasmid replication protein [Emticicia sp. BO119]MBA4852401.1 hypothetical protein [Emticicia sp. BO119]